MFFDDSILLCQFQPTIYQGNVGHDRSFYCAGSLDISDPLVPEERRKKEGYGNSERRKQTGGSGGAAGVAFSRRVFFRI
jgi:hypothetical protein